MNKVFVFLAEGFEEIEALTAVDLLRRADLNVRMAAVSPGEFITGAHGIVIRPDMYLEAVRLEDAVMLVLPGGNPGTMNLNKSEQLLDLLKTADSQKIPIGAICAAPRILGELGILEGKQAVCYPGNEEWLKGAEVLKVPVVTDGHITTGRGMGTAIDFSLELITRLKGKEEAKRIAASIIYEK